MQGYFDNAATSFPKHEAVAEWVNRYIAHGGTYGRSASRRNMEVAHVVEQTRDLIAERIGAESSDNITFTPGATYSINMVLRSLAPLLENGEVLVSQLEHNAVMRPLTLLAHKHNITIKGLESRADGSIIVERICEQLTPQTKLVIVNHQSNVNGVIQPIGEIKRTLGEVLLLVDASQSAGTPTRLNMNEMSIDFVCFSAHKGFRASTGIGALYARQMKLVQPLIIGGTGSRSDSFEMPCYYPDLLEASTPNLMGIYGWCGALNSFEEPRHTTKDFLAMVTEVEQCGRYTIYKSLDSACQGETFSVCHNQMSSSELAEKLYEEYGIETRSGLHCAPQAHRFLGSFESGSVRISPSPTHTAEELRELTRILTNL